MIALLVAGAWWSVTPAATDSVTLVAMVPLETHTASERACAELWAATVMDGTTHYQPHDLVMLGSSGDFMPRATVGADHLALAVSVPASQMPAGVDVLCELAFSPKLSPEALLRAKEELPFRKQGAWMRALSGPSPEWQAVDRRLLLQFHQRLFRPERMSIAVSGPVDEMGVRSEWALRQPKVAARKPREVLGGKWRADAEDYLGGWVMEISGQDLDAQVALEPETFLAACALGVGKGSSLFRVLRQQEQLSYRQEAAMWPTSKGLRWRAWLRRVDPMAGPLPDDVLEKLERDVASWTELDLKRAKVMLRSSLEAKGPIFPLRFDADRAVLGSVQDLTRLSCWWPLKSGKPLDRQAFLETADATGLDSLKERARLLIQQATIVAWR